MLEIILMAQTAVGTCYYINDAGQYVNLNDGLMCPQIGTIESSAVSIPSVPTTFGNESAPIEESFIPFAGNVCADFATQGEAQYHYMLGTAPDSVDGDKDGIACEELENIPNRMDGSRVSTYRSTRYAGVDIELFDVGRRIIDGEFYLRVTAPGLGLFTTRSFSDRPEAEEHMRIYYGYTQGL